MLDDYPYKEIEFSKITRITLLVLVLISNPASAEYLGPCPYLSFDDSSTGTSISPFANKNFVNLFLEDFDGVLNTPGVTLRECATTNIPTVFSDSVDGDDDVIDGISTGQTRSLFSDLTVSSFTFQLLYWAGPYLLMRVLYGLTSGIIMANSFRWCFN